MFQDFRLKVFYTCALKGSFSKAAEVLGISQPAVSKHISELEKNCLYRSISWNSSTTGAHRDRP